MKPIDHVVGSILILAVVVAGLSFVTFMTKRDKVEMKGEAFAIQIKGQQVICNRITYPSAEGYLCVVP